MTETGTCVSCAIRTVEAWKNNNIKQCVDYVCNIIADGMSDVMVPQQMSDDDNVCLWLEGFMIDPIRELTRAQALTSCVATESSTSMSAWLSDNFLVLRDEETLSSSIAVRSYWGWMNFFNSLCDSDTDLLSIVDVRINGQAALFSKELWSELQLEEEGYVKLNNPDAPLMVTGVDPMTGETITMDNDSPESARNVVWLQCLVLGLLKSSLGQFTFMLEHKTVRPAMMSMTADVNFLLWLQDKCSHQS